MSPLDLTEDQSLTAELVNDEDSSSLDTAVMKGSISEDWEEFPMIDGDRLSVLTSTGLLIVEVRFANGLYSFHSPRQVTKDDSSIMEALDPSQTWVIRTGVDGKPFNLVLYIENGIPKIRGYRVAPCEAQERLVIDSASFTQAIPEAMRGECIYEFHSTAKVSSTPISMLMPSPAAQDYSERAQTGADLFPEEETNPYPVDEFFNNFGAEAVRALSQKTLPSGIQRQLTSGSTQYGLAGSSPSAAANIVETEEPSSARLVRSDGLPTSSMGLDSAGKAYAERVLALIRQAS